MFLIVGLGNPGEKYIGTRHSLGFEVVDALARKLGVGSWELEKKFKAEMAQATHNSSLITHHSILAKPQTYMNLSGMAVSALVNYYKIPPENIIVIQDELDLPLGHIKLRLGGSGAGHHGVESIIEKLGTDKFIRIRLGIGNLQSQSGEHKHRSFNAEHFVLDYFAPSEKSSVKRMIKEALKAIDIILEKGLDKAQHQFN